MSSSPSAQSKFAGFNPVQIAVDFALCGLFFALIFYFVRSHVMSKDQTMIVIFSTYTTLCVTGAFWLALQMLRVVIKGERILKAERAGR
jgi:hypothetical protein